MKIEFANLNGLHILDEYITDGDRVLRVCRTVPAMGFPTELLFDSVTWYYYCEVSMFPSEAAQYRATAQYRMTKPCEVKLNGLKIDEYKVLDTQYFVVGATWDNGATDMLPEFLRRGYWINGYGRDNLIYNAVVDQMRPGDRIAVKRLKGKGSADMDILALGIIKEVYSDDQSFTAWVKWLVQIKRTVPLCGCVGTVHGPWLYNSTYGPRIRDIFTI